MLGSLKSYGQFGADIQIRGRSVDPRRGGENLWRENTFHTPALRLFAFRRVEQGVTATNND